MLHEIKNVKQERGPGRRRWFESDGFDVVVWFDSARRVTGFQVCYDFGRGEYALTWRGGMGFAHSKVDSGDGSPLKNQAPILEPDGRVPWAEITRHFDERSVTLEPELRQLIHERLYAMA